MSMGENGSPSGIILSISGSPEKLTDGKGKLKKEFQTAYTLPLHFGMTEGEESKAMADNLARLLINDGYKVGTGFPGTPYLLFALSDHGHCCKAEAIVFAAPFLISPKKISGKEENK